MAAPGTRPNFAPRWLRPPPTWLKEPAPERSGGADDWEAAFELARAAEAAACNWARRSRSAASPAAGGAGGGACWAA